jgi:tetrahydromethanopterin S-methyltransferase subunit G
MKPATRMKRLIAANQKDIPKMMADCREARLRVEKRLDEIDKIKYLI